jgi:hypothetical protein
MTIEAWAEEFSDSRASILATLATAVGDAEANKLAAKWRREARLRDDNAASAAKAKAQARGRKDAHLAEPRKARITQREAEARDARMRRELDASHGTIKGKPIGERIADKQRRNMERQRRYQERNRKHLDALTAKLQAAGQLDACPRGVPPKAWACVKACQRDTTATTHKRYLAELPPMIARLCRNAATLRGTAWERPIAHPTARRTLVCLLGLWHCSRPSQRSGFARVTTGIPLGMVDAWVCPPHVERPRDEHGRRKFSRTHLTGESRGIPAPLRAAKEFGVFDKKRPDAADVHPADRGPSGYAMNQYHWPRYSNQGKAAPEATAARIRELSGPGILAELGLVTEPAATSPPD